MSSVTISDRLPMISAIGEAASKKYHKYIGKDGKIWLVAIQPNAADNIYVEGGANSDGFGGQILTFNLDDGSKLSLKGPWHTNSESLFYNTDIDVRNQHYTYGIVALNRKYDSKINSTIYTDVIYQDDNWVVGEFNRIENIAQKLANELKKSVYVYRRSMGGAMSTRITPDA